jgi:hypothetical protein
MAVWYSSDSWRSPVRLRSSVSNRVFSIAMTAWSAKRLQQLDLALRKRPGLGAVHCDDADWAVLAQHRHRQQTAEADGFRPIQAPVIGILKHVGNMHDGAVGHGSGRPVVTGRRGRKESSGRLNGLGREIAFGNKMDQLTVIPVNAGVQGVAQPRGIVRNGFENGAQIPWPNY